MVCRRISVQRAPALGKPGREVETAADWPAVASRSALAAPPKRFGSPPGGAASRETKLVRRLGLEPRTY